MEEQKNNPSTEDINALFDNLENSPTDIVDGENSFETSSLGDDNTADTEETLRSIQQLQEEIPELQNNSLNDIDLTFDDNDIPFTPTSEANNTSNSADGGDLGLQEFENLEPSMMDNNDTDASPREDEVPDLGGFDEAPQDNTNFQDASTLDEDMNLSLDDEDNTPEEAITTEDADFDMDTPIEEDLSDLSTNIDDSDSAPENLENNSLESPSFANFLGDDPNSFSNQGLGGNDTELRLEDINDGIFGNFDSAADPFDGMDMSYELDPRDDENVPEISEEEKTKILQHNISILSEDLAIHIKGIFDHSPSNDPLALSLRKELEKTNINLETIKKISHFTSEEIRPKKKLMRFSMVAGTLLVLYAIYAGYHYFATAEDRILQTGLDMIEDGRVDQGNRIFLQNKPNLGWYNKYANAMIEQVDYPLAEIKLFGDGSSQVGALEINPNDKETLMTTSKLFAAEGQYDKALSTKTQYKGKDIAGLEYLLKRYPRDFSVLDLVGSTRIAWAEQTQDPKIKEDQLSQAEIMYLKLNKQYTDNPTILSRLLEISLVSENPKIKQQLAVLSHRDILNKIDQNVLAKIGLHYLENNLISEATLFFNTLKIHGLSGKTKKYSPLAQYFIGDFYLNATDFGSAENNLILSSYGNTRRDTQGNVLAVRNPSLQGKISNALGRLYTNLLQQYSTTNEFNKKNRQDYIDLANYHLKEAQKYNSSDPMNDFLMGEIAYNANKDYPKSVQYYEKARSLMVKKNIPIPIQMSYNYGHALYMEQDYNKAIRVLSDLRTDRPLYYPALEYLLGMSYLKTNINSQAADKMSRALEYFTPSLQAIQKRGYANRLQENQLLYLSSVISNNLGYLYQVEGDTTHNEAMLAQARTYFYNAIDYSKRLNPNLTATYPELNFDTSVFQGNMQTNGTPNIQGQKPLLYEYTPDSVMEYQ